MKKNYEDQPKDYMDLIQKSIQELYRKLNSYRSTKRCTLLDEIDLEDYDCPSLTKLNKMYPGTSILFSEGMSVLKVKMK